MGGMDPEKGNDTITAGHHTAGATAGGTSTSLPRGNNKYTADTVSMVGITVSKQRSIQLVSDDNEDDNEDSTSMEKMYNNDNNEPVNGGSSHNTKFGEKSMKNVLIGKNDDDQLQYGTEGVRNKNDGYGNTRNTNGYVDSNKFNGVNFEAFVQDWTAKQVSNWLKGKLVDGKIDSRLIDNFIIEWDKQHVTGKVLNICRNDTQSLKEIKQQIQENATIDGLTSIWMIVRYEIQNM